MSVPTSTSPADSKAAATSEAHAPGWPLACETHGSRPAIARCTSCGRFICEPCRTVRRDGRARCLHCNRGVVASSVAFERPGNFVSRFSQTAREVFFTPQRFMAELDLSGPVLPAFLFGWIATLIGHLINVLWNAVFFSEAFYDTVAEAAEMAETTTTTVLLSVVTILLPMVSAMTVTLSFMLLYVGVLFTQTKESYNLRAYSRIAGYACAANLLWVVPLIGPFLALWSMGVICWHALRVRHDLPPGRAILAVLPLAIGTLLFQANNGF